MIENSNPTIHSNLAADSFEMTKARKEWPMANYMAAWKTFRRVGNEPSATADHLLERPRWPKKNPFSIIDIGCGDGRMLEEFVLKSPRDISQVILLDPDKNLLAEAKKEIGSPKYGYKLQQVVGTAEVEGTRLARKADVGLAIHVAYLMSHEKFVTFIEDWPAGIPLYVVLDAPTSVFSELWRTTAPEYAERAAQVHAYLEGETKAEFGIKMSEFATNVANPYELNERIRELVLSLLCYNDFSSLSASIRAGVKRTLMRHAKGDVVDCTCRCYEIVK
jgi:SAM-dependent methyltransferase